MAPLEWSQLETSNSVMRTLELWRRARSTARFVSAVERGHTVPSVAALALLTDRLETGLEEFFRGVNEQMTRVYTAAHEHHDTDPTSRRR